MRLADGPFGDGHLAMDHRRWSFGPNPATVPVGTLCIKSIFQAEIAEVINPLHIKEAKNIIASKIYEQTNKPPTFVQQNQEMSKAPIQYDPATGKILHNFRYWISLSRPYSSPRLRWHEIIF